MVCNPAVIGTKAYWEESHIHLHSDSPELAFARISSLCIRELRPCNHKCLPKVIPCKAGHELRQFDPLSWLALCTVLHPLRVKWSTM